MNNQSSYSLRGCHLGQYPQLRSQRRSPFQIQVVHVSQFQNYSAAPILPSIRGQHCVDSRPAEVVQNVAAVASHPDYDMRLMSRFVAEISYGMCVMLISDLPTLMQRVSLDVSPSSWYYEYVFNVLSATRLTNSTILLGMFYLALRIKLISMRGVKIYTFHTICSMLITSLLLGNKYLDDNTFWNRSWAEVSDITVLELNMIELQWLKDFSWAIHGPIYHQEEGFSKWIEYWHVYKEKHKCK
jgi:Cyclin